MVAGNVWLREALIPEYNARFGKEPEEERSAPGSNHSFHGQPQEEHFVAGL